MGNEEEDPQANGIATGEKEKEVEEIKNTDPVVVDTPPNNGAAAATPDGKAENPMHAGKANQVEPKGGDGEPGKKDAEEEEEVKQVGFFSIFRFADALDIFLLIVGTIAALAHGAALPLVLVLFGEVIDAFIPSTDMTTELPTTGTDPLQLIKDFSVSYVYLGLGVLGVAFLQASCWNMAAERQVRRVRVTYFRAILSQDISWFDLKKSGELTTRISDDINKIRSGTGDKVALAIQSISTAIAGVTVGFIYSWKLSLVIMAVSFGLIIPVFGCSAYFIKKFTQGALDAYAKAGAVAEEAFSAMRTVTAFGGESKELERYGNNLGDAQTIGVKKAGVESFSLGAIFGIIYGSYAIAFWYGTKLIVNPNEEFTPGDILITFFSVLFGSFSIAQAGPYLTEFSSARGAAFAIWETIDNVPKIDAQSEKGSKPSKLEGKISFEDVHFVYPSRTESKVLQGLNLEVNVGQSVALVGSSGCGKSTTVALVQRYYDTVSGTVKIDGKDIKSYNVKWLREHVGVVSQEPVLFATTIDENIRYGRLDVTEEEIIQAAKEANAHDFIMELPEKYKTLVGERGAQLSGGQKQRIAIARALVRNPRILLLDEATSALDSESEGIVQSALEKAQHGRTTIVIAHRLSTIKNSDKICAMRDGVVVEQGTHADLMSKQDGVYAGLVQQQQTKDIKEESESEEDEEEEEMVKEMTRQLSAGKIKRSESRSSGRKKGIISQMSVVSAASENEGMADSSMGDGEEEEEDLEGFFDMGRVLKMNATEAHFITIGVIAAAFNGAVQPAFAIIFSRVLGVYGTSMDPLQDIIPWCIFFAVLGVVALFAQTMQGLTFALSGEKLTRRLRYQMFKALMRQEMSFFDDHKHNTGALTTRLATDASLVQGVTGVRFGLVAEVVFNIVVAIIISFIYSWHLTLLVLAFVPLIGIAGVLNWQLFEGGANAQREDLEEAGKTVTEASENIRTVQSLTRELTFWEKYRDLLAQSQKRSYTSAIFQGATFAFSQCIIYFAYSATFRLGGFLVFEKQGEKLEFENVFLVFSAIIFGAFGLGRAFAYTPDFQKAKKATARMFKLFDTVPPIDKYQTEGLEPEDLGSEVSFENVRFRYPTRPDVPVLSGLCLSVKSGETLALVGSSGCGKSTTVALIERFYDSRSGEVMAGAYDIKVLNLPWWRQQIGLVSQEPVLFDRSIAENIAYGDNNREVPQEEVEAAARKANIHDFIVSLPMGYETNVGDKGTQLSGGQKQRIAIARALVRHPRILLLDEATSALDTESEKVVQAALDEAKKGRTCITIAHRLSTVHDANRIVVIKHGKVSESGTHEELMALKGQYYGLYTKQSLQE